jgi:hypothetical protein
MLNYYRSKEHRVSAVYTFRFTTVLLRQSLVYYSKQMKERKKESSASLISSFSYLLCKDVVNLYLFELN